MFVFIANLNAGKFKFSQSNSTELPYIFDKLNLNVTLKQRTQKSPSLQRQKWFWLVLLLLGCLSQQTELFNCTMQQTEFLCSLQREQMRNRVLTSWQKRKFPAASLVRKQLGQRYKYATSKSYFCYERLALHWNCYYR